MVGERVEGLNLVTKLAKIRVLSDVAQKSKKGYNYTYVDITTILANVTAGMKKYGVSLIPSVVPGTAQIAQIQTVNTKLDKTGKAFDSKATEMLFTAETNFRWINDDDTNDYIDVHWFATGSMPDCSQAMGSAMSYMLRQFLISFFQIATPENDVDAYRSKQKAAEAEEEKIIAESIISQFDEMLKLYLADNPKKKEEVQKFIGRYAKNANYFAIKEPNLAAKLLNDFQNTYSGFKKESDFDDLSGQCGDDKA